VSLNTELGRIGNRFLYPGQAKTAKGSAAPERERALRKRDPRKLRGGKGSREENSENQGKKKQITSRLGSIAGAKKRPIPKEGRGGPRGKGGEKKNGSGRSPKEKTQARAARRCPDRLEGTCCGAAERERRRGRPVSLSRGSQRIAMQEGFRRGTNARTYFRVSRAKKKGKARGKKKRVLPSNRRGKNRLFPPY